jgi:hypothetical protein
VPVADKPAEVVIYEFDQSEVMEIGVAPCWHRTGIGSGSGYFTGWG